MTHLPSQLSGKVALVTGGSRGIGAAIVRRLAEDGAAVAFTYSASADRAATLAAEITDSGGTALAFRADSGDVAEIRAAVAETAAAFGHIDILINNAGILLRNSVEDYDLADFDRMFAVNVRAPFVAAQAVLPHMPAGGRIIHTGSVAAERSGFPGASVYSATKGAIASMTRGLARDLGPRGITVNAIQPGPTITDMSGGKQAEGMLAPLMALGRMGEDREVASFVAYLASPESSFITGSALTIDGGYLA
jgi:3-oxoacyl-[acyl-carrier protein] reductase